jgi:aspartate-semialdehyde dehydrogenase
VLGADQATELDVLFLATDGEVSRSLVEGPARSVPLIVDNSSAYRLDPDVPLVVPEANARALAGYEGGLVANPNCTTAAAVVALAPIRDLAGLEAVDVASYQAVSGAGRAGVDAFVAERATEHRDPAPETPFHGRIADSVVPQIDRLFDDGWSGEERKIRAELRKILDMPELDVAATTVRVPVHTGHSVALHLRTARPTTVPAIEEALRQAPGVEYRPADGSERHPMPLDAEGRDPVLVGRLRAIPDRERGFALFVASDNLRKGAALNAIQVAAAFDPDRFGCLLPPPR